MKQSIPTNLIVQLKQVEAGEYFNALCRDMNVKELNVFSQQLREWANAYHVDALLDYAQNLQNALDNYDWNTIPTILSCFELLVQQCTLMVEE